MANVTVPKFFDIERKIEEGFDLQGAPKKYDVEKCKATRDEVAKALKQVGEMHPELHDCMRVAVSMLTHLDAIRDEAKGGLFGILWLVTEGRTEKALVQIGATLKMLGKWGDAHTLYVH